MRSVPELSSLDYGEDLLLFQVFTPCPTPVSPSPWSREEGISY